MSSISIAKIELTHNEIEAVVAVLKSGALRQGKVCEAFEKAYAEKVGAAHAVTVANGTAALHLPYLTFLKPGDEVLMPSLTFIATASMVTVSGGTPVFCDIDPETFLLDLSDAETKVTEKTRAICPVHLYGNPCDIDAVTAFARKHRLRIVWDAAQAHGATFDGKDVGAFDDFVCYSFYPSKNMFVGEGGMICTNNDDIASQLRFLKSHGETGRYYHTMIGFNYRMTDVEAAIGLEQLKRLDDMMSIRRRNADRLNEGLRDVPGITPQKPTPKSIPAWHQYCVLVDKDVFGMDRDVLAGKLKEQGIATGVHYPRGLHQQPIMESLYGHVRLPHTEYVVNNILALPVHHGLTPEDIDAVVYAIRPS